MADNLQRLRSLMRSFPLTEGPLQTRLPFLTLYRHTTKKAVLPYRENDYIYIW